MTAIINATLVMRDHLIPNGVLLMEDGKITAFGESRKMEIPAGCEIIDAEGKYVGPGFVDIHTHSDGKVFFYDDPKSVGHHLKHGTTTILAALYFSMTTQEFVDAMGKIREAMKDPDCRNLCGIYMEGKRGAAAFCDVSTGEVCVAAFMCNIIYHVNVFFQT